MWRSWLEGMLALGVLACVGAQASEPERGAADVWRPGNRTWDRTLPAGTLVEAITCHEIDGTLTAVVSGDVRNARRWVVIPAGSPVGLRIVPGRHSPVALDITSVTVAGAMYPLTGTVAAMGTRVLFVLRDGLTVAPHRAASASIVASPFDAGAIRLPTRSC